MDKVIFVHLNNLTALTGAQSWVTDILEINVFYFSSRRAFTWGDMGDTTIPVTSPSLSLAVWERGFEDTHYHPWSTTHITSITHLRASPIWQPGSHRSDMLLPDRSRGRKHAKLQCAETCLLLPLQYWGCFFWVEH